MNARSLPALRTAVGATLVLAIVTSMVAVRARDGAGAAPASEDAVSAASLFIDPQGAVVVAGGGAQTLSETVAGVPYDPGLGGFQIDISYDPNVVALGVAEGPFLASTGRPTLCQTTFPAARYVRFRCTSSGDQRGPYGKGALATLTVRPAAGLTLRPTLGNGVLAVIDNLRATTALFDAEGALIPLGQVLDGLVLARALDGDVNIDCSVNILDEQLISTHYGATRGTLLYQQLLDLEPPPGDLDIDIKDLQFVFGRSDSNCQTPQPTPLVTETPVIPTVPAVTRTASPTRTAAPSNTATASPTLTITPAAPSPTRTAAAATPPSTKTAGPTTPSPTRTAGTTTPGPTRTAGTTTPAPTHTAGTTTPAPTHTPRTQTAIGGTSTPATATRTTVAAASTAAPGRSPSPVSTVLGVSRLPATGEDGARAGRGWEWAITAGSIAAGVLVVIALRQALFRRRD